MLLETFTSQPAGEECSIEDLFYVVNACIEAIGDEMQRIFDSLINIPGQDHDSILRQMESLRTEHDNLMPHWRALRSLLNFYQMREGNARNQ